MNASPFRAFNHRVQKIVASLVLGLTLIACNPHPAVASGDDDVEHYDARVQGYDPDLELKSSGTGGAWVMMILLGVVCVAVIFKDAKRSHLD